MKVLILSLCIFSTACSMKLNDRPRNTVAPQEQFDDKITFLYQPYRPSQPKTPVTKEKIETVKNLFEKNFASLNDNLNKAKELKSTKYWKSPREISQAECGEYQLKISTNYKIHSYYDAESKTEKMGLEICPKYSRQNQVFNGQWIVSSSVHAFLENLSTNNQMGINAAKLLAVTYQIQDLPILVTQQYIIDANNRLIEYIRTAENMDFAKEYFVEVFTQSAEGNVFGNIYKLWELPNAASLWKNTQSFVPANGNEISAIRYIQNDQNGIEVTTNSFTLPQNWKWDTYEASPLTKLSGLYKSEGKINKTAQSVFTYAEYKSANNSCEDGYQGFDTNGSYIRQFGAIDCIKALGVETTKY